MSTADDGATARPRRINVRGTSGAGKSTFGAELARRLGVGFVELDALHHGPNWAAPTSEEFRAKVREAMAAAPNGWVIDGNYDSKLGDTVFGEADTIVWLDLPLFVKLPRLCRRTFHRIRNRIELWNGNRETWTEAVFHRDSVIYWMIRNHFEQRRDWPARFAGDDRVVRLRSDAEARRWLDEQTRG
ncbi:MAG TPA: shikimate kinase [Thermomicrobiales bacterium]